MIEQLIKQIFKPRIQLNFNFEFHVEIFQLIFFIYLIADMSVALAQPKPNLCQKIFLTSKEKSLHQIIDTMLILNNSIHESSEPQKKQSLINKLNHELRLMWTTFGQEAVFLYYQKINEFQKKLAEKSEQEKINKASEKDFTPHIYQTDLSSLNSYFFATEINKRFFLSIDRKLSTLNVIDSENLDKSVQILLIPAMLNNGNTQLTTYQKHISLAQRNQFTLTSNNLNTNELIRHIFDFKTQTFTHVAVTRDLITKLYHYNPKYNVSVLQENERVNGMIREFLRLKYSNGKIVTITGSAINQLKLVNDDFALFIKDNSTLECLIWKTGELIKLFSNSVRLLFINDHFALFLNRNDANKYEVIKVAMKNGQIIQSVIGTFDHFITKSDSENNDRILVQVANEQKGLYRIIDYNQAKITEEFKIDNAPKDFMYNKDRLFLGDYSYIVTQNEELLTFIPIGNKKVSSEAITLPRDLETKSNIFNTKTLQLIEIFYDRVQLTHLISKEVLTISLPYKFREITQYLLSENQKILIIAGHTTNNENKSVLIHLSM